MLFVVVNDFGDFADFTAVITYYHSCDLSSFKMVHWLWIFLRKHNCPLILRYDDGFLAHGSDGLFG